MGHSFHSYSMLAYWWLASRSKWLAIGKMMGYNRGIYWDDDKHEKLLGYNGNYHLVIEQFAMENLKRLRIGKSSNWCTPSNHSQNQTNHLYKHCSCSTVVVRNRSGSHLGHGGSVVIPAHRYVCVYVYIYISILYTAFHFISVHSISFHSIPFHSNPFHSKHTYTISLSRSESRPAMSQNPGTRMVP